MAKSKLKPVNFTDLDKREETEPITFRVPKSLKDRLEKFSKKSGHKSSDLLRHIIKEFLDAQGA